MAYFLALLVIVPDLRFPIQLKCYVLMQIYDGYDDTTPVLITACGHDLPEPAESTSNVAYILFRNSGGSMGSLFLLKWAQVTKVIDDNPWSLITFNCEYIVQKLYTQKRYPISSDTFCSHIKPFF